MVVAQIVRVGTSSVPQQSLRPIACMTEATRGGPLEHFHKEYHQYVRLVEVSSVRLRKWNTRIFKAGHDSLSCEEGFQGPLRPERSLAHAIWRFPRT